MTKDDFEQLLNITSKELTQEASKRTFQSSKEFENRSREIIASLLDPALRAALNISPNPQEFPDIVIGQFGVEVKFTTQDTWRSVANSILESTRSPYVQNIYVLFGKMGGKPAVRWGEYAQCVMHVRTSHVPRFELEIGADRSLFETMGVPYKDFSALPLSEKMRHVRKYARGRLKPGEHLWWLGENHTLPPQVKLYMYLSQQEKRRMRAEAALLCPQIVKPPRSKQKYDDAVMYILTYYGVLCPQARDLFSAGSVAMRADQTRGGIYIARALMDIEDEMLSAAKKLDNSLFEEYWGAPVPAGDRIPKWLERADSLAKEWKPSAVLFRGKRGVSRTRR